MDMMVILWLVALVVFIVVEGITTALVSIWFAVGSIAALLVAAIWPQAILAQALVFVVVSVVTFLLLRPVLSKIGVKKRVATNADANIGKHAEVTEAIMPGQIGRAQLDGLSWAATSDTELPVGSWCRVDDIQGVKLVVSPLQNTPDTE